MGKARTKHEDKRVAKHSLDAKRPSAAGTKTGQRDAATVRRLQMYKKRAVRNKKGQLIYQELQSKELPSTRIQPDRRWFGNTRVVGQKQLEAFREEMSSKVNDAYTVLVRERKLPMQLLEDPEEKLKKAGKEARASLLAVQSFQSTFGKSKTRKRPNLKMDSLEEMVTGAEEVSDKFTGEEGYNKTSMAHYERDTARDAVFDKGQSKRIWGELYKVVDSSDVLIQVLDARDPMGTRCRHLESHLKRNCKHKHLLLLLNKCDLVPAWVTKRWLHTLSREYPTLAFHASVTNPFGKGSLLSLLRQLARLRTDKKAISVGFVGYPNVGKSSVINALRTKKVCKTAPVPGETKVWQYVTLMKRIFLIDCPGVVYNKTQDSDVDTVLKGVVRVENLEDASEYIAPVLARVKPEYLMRAYKVKPWRDAEDFLTQIATKSGKLLKGGDPDLNTAARMVLYDWQRGKIPFFYLPPDYTPEDNEKAQQELEMPAEAVEPEDARDAEGGLAERAAVAVLESVGVEASKQLAEPIPVQTGMFNAEDIGPDKGENEEVEHNDSDAVSKDSEGSSGSEASGDDVDDDSDSDDSVGYGEGGLSWEAVMASMNGAEAEVEEEEEAAAAPPTKAGKRRASKAVPAAPKKQKNAVQKAATAPAAGEGKASEKAVRPGKKVAGGKKSTGKPAALATGGRKPLAGSKSNPAKGRQGHKPAKKKSKAA
mmetsp:Transcript_14612/g.41110  ORF Transcript_14612/g.41110 Transcript_14612/m.41110 type:complete len:708 (-) Transcript_14612:179-2302(-)|eukprot:CAMPEP_0117680610 /NCGR_PEP_ID=MMETSP0804-20121206/18457_1 /TAXON_ID=1074897 /ORGANISM="Tetraselmis astigmatica, Strain CCMP880" /LENGTH=707 /DNA_ID=CAMNT_0005490145 /DNA_START=82 /DNA_END=2205 /DNA_ORIENTATION=-